MEVKQNFRPREQTRYTGSEIMKDSSYIDLEYAKLDISREERTGHPEVVFCQGKKEEHLIGIFRKLYEECGRVLGTRATASQFEAVKKEFPEAVFDETSGIIILGDKVEGKGLIAVCTAGTSDIPVSEEAALTAEFFGNNVSRFYDVGVSGIHRLLDVIDDIRKANVVIAVAGMEGALPSVIGGLVEVPVIAVPTSVGYGASFEGVTALLSMMNSCANGISVVNIDNGYGAGYTASRINHLAVKGKDNG